MAKMILLFFILHFFHFTIAVSHVSSSSATLSDFSNNPEKVINKQRNLDWDKPLELPVVNKKELIKQRNVEYSRRYRKLHPDRTRESGQSYYENIRKDPINWQEKRLKRKAYNAKYRQKIKLAKDIERTADRTDKKDHYNKVGVLTGKREQVTAENDIPAKRPRILHYGRPPMSNAFIPPESENAIDRESAINPTEANSQRPRHIVRIKLAKYNAKSSSSSTQGPPREGADQQSTT